MESPIQQPLKQKLNAPVENPNRYKGANINTTTRGVQYVMKTAQYIPKFYIYTLHNYFYLNICFLAK